MPNNIANSDPAEGPREVIEHELARQEGREKTMSRKRKADPKRDQDEKRPPRKN